MSGKADIPGGKRARTRAALIEAAGAVVDEKGFRAAGLDEIAARAGMTKGAIYSNFGGKADLMLALARTRSVSISPALLQGATLKQQLLALADAVIEMLPRAAERAQLDFEFQLYVLQEPTLRAPVAQAYEEGLAVHVDLTRQFCADQLAIDPASLVMALQCLALGFAHQYRITPHLVTPSVVRDGFAALADGVLKRSA